jgi:hypothetical protein
VSASRAAADDRAAAPPAAGGAPGARAVLGLGAALLLPLASAVDALAAGPAAAGLVRLAFASTAPGWLLVELGAPWLAGGLAATALRALVLSPLVYALATLALRLGAGLELASAARAAAWAICAALALVALRGLRASQPRSDEGSVPRPRAAGGLVALAPVAGFAALAAWVFATPGTRLSYHGLLHAGIVAQIAVGVVPPENPALAGEPIGFYWIYHWLLAAQGALAGLSILATAPFLNGVALVAYGGASQRIRRRFRAPGRAALASLAAGFAGNLAFPLLFAAGALRAGLPAPGAHLPFELLAVGLPGGDPRLVTLLAKFLSMSGFPLGLACFAILLDELVPAAGRRPRGALVFLALSGAVLFHTTTALGAIPALGAGWLAAHATRDLRASARAVLPVAGAFLAALAATAPYLASVTAAAHAPSPFPPGRAVLGYGAQGLVFGATSLVLVVALAARRAASCATGRFLLAATASLVAMGVLLSLPDGNQYKLLLLAALPGGTLLFWCLREGASRAARAASALAIALAVTGHALTAAAYLRSNMPLGRHVAGDGGYLMFPGNPPLDAALRWLRAHTPPDAVVISRPVPFGESPISAGSGRNDFVLEGGHQTFGNPRYLARVALVQQLLTPEGFAGPLAAQLRRALARPLYVLLVRSDDPAAFERVARKLDRAPEAFEGVYRSPAAALWLVRESEGGPEAPRPGARRAPRAGRGRRARSARGPLPSPRSRRRTP